MGFKQGTYLILLLLSLNYISSLDLKIVDEDYLEVQVGGIKKPMKLLIDPVGHFTYLLKPFESGTKVNQFKSIEWANAFGTFKGDWESDFFFITPDHQFGFRLKYVKVTQKESILDCDGVIGLGYSDDVPDEANIHKLLGSMKDVFSLKKVMTYDKKNKRLVLGTVPSPDSYNPVYFDIIQPNKQYPVNLVTLDKIGYFQKDKKLPDYIDINQPAKLGLIPVIIAPNKSKDLLTKQLIPAITKNPESIKEQENEKKFFNDFFFTEPNKDIKGKGVIMFGKIGYKFDHTWKDGDKFSSTIRLGDEVKGIDYWYIGIDKLDVNRMDFDFEKQKVILYSATAAEVGKTKYPLMFKALGIATVFTIIACIIIRCFCQKKKQSLIQEGQELAYL